MEKKIADIKSGNVAMGLEFGSTRVKAVLVDASCEPIASGDYEWENKLENGIWTYSLEDIWKGLSESFAALKKDVMDKYNCRLNKVACMGFSAMMHGYMAFDKEGRLLVPFRTWRNGITGEAAEELTELFQYNIPQRWSIAHLYQAMLNNEPHVKDIAYITTLAGFIHWQLTGEKVLGVGDASGMFPIDTDRGDYDQSMLDKFEKLAAQRGYPVKLRDILPRILFAGDTAGKLTEEGALRLSPDGELEYGCPVCPPEGDAGTGMVATNSVARGTGNVSAGTSIFGMVVMDKKLSVVYPEIDLVTTPDGSPVAMVHANNCTSDLNAWVGIFDDYNRALGIQVDKNRLYETLYKAALDGDADCGGVLAYGYLSGENITGVQDGRPMVLRTPDSNFNLANLMRAHLFSSLGALKIGMDILTKRENVEIHALYGHGGLFKTKGVGEGFLAAATGTPVKLMETAGEGGPWGMAVLASYMNWRTDECKLEQFLNDRVFAGNEARTAYPTEADMAGFEAFLNMYKQGLPVERKAGECL